MADRPFTFVETSGKNFGYVFTVEEAYKFIGQLETQTTTKFTCYTTVKDFGAIDCTKRSHKVCWEDKKDVQGPRIAYTGTPFMYLGEKVYDCQHGKDRKVVAKQRRKEAVENGDIVTKKPRVVQSVLKVNCTARIKLREILMFPEFKIIKDTPKRRRLSSLRVRAAVKTGNFHPERRIYIEFPSSSDHQNHLVGEAGGMCQPVDKRITNRIHELVAEGIKDVNQVRHQVEFFVKNVLFRDKELPKTTNRRFYPTTKDIRTHVYNATVKNRTSSQESGVPDQLASSTDTLNVSMVDHELPIMESSVSVVELPISNVTFETIQANAVGLSAGVDPQVEGQKMPGFVRTNEAAYPCGAG
ncbi:hypothetical protein OS493_005589 [Desmophyllum pertusum]|uniref:Uncharacterized protein n=1 Tax=Desmophyllum pertusum TaxID=174260 RepID=A0A9W9YSN6_9CNID|nr:hypothetical protein OS493_005589 [Desmophyllum pertusum]